MVNGNPLNVRSVSVMGTGRYRAPGHHRERGRYSDPAPGIPRVVYVQVPRVVHVQGDHAGHVQGGQARPGPSHGARTEPQSQGPSLRAKDLASEPGLSLRART